MTSKAKLTIGIAALVIAGGVAARNLLMPATHSVPIVADPEAGTAAKFDHLHAAFDALLKAHVKDERVDYAALKADPSALNGYLGRLASVREEEFANWDQSQQLAMLINLYNAATLKLIIDHYPVESIKDIGGLFKKPWSIESLSLFGTTTTLDHLEHEVLRKRFAEPRIHFAIVCAANGCPALRPGAYTGNELDAQLNEQGEKFLRDPAKNRVDAANRTLYLSKIFDWFEEDFEKGGSVIEFVRPYLPEADAAALEGDFRIRYTDYDWSLNEQGT